MKFSFSILILILFALACGGDKFEAKSIDSSPNYKGKTETASIDKNSYLEIAHSFLGSPVPTLASLPKNSNEFENHGMRFFLIETQNLIISLSHDAIENQSFFTPSFSGLFGGKVNFRGDWNHETGTIVFNFENFSQNGHIAWDGLVQVNYLKGFSDNSSFQHTDIYFSELSFKTDRQTYLTKGHLSQEFNVYSGETENIWNVSIQGQAIELKLENYRESGYKSFIGYYQSKFEGNFYHNLHGQVHVKTSSETEFQGQMPSMGGPIIMTGSTGSNLKVKPEGFGLIHYELDHDGDMVYESIHSQSHYQSEIY